MRKSAAALVLTLLASLCAFVPAVSAAGPKAVVIVGATHSATAGYRTSADVYYNVLREYTSNVVRIYSPNATWSKVKAELQGASIVIYLGHGNGFPSPYSTSPRPETQNGLGLNATAGNGDGNTKYYGEYYIGRDIKLAPNAIVLFNRLCYASGNDESGGTASSVGVAKARVDNYAAGFIKAGARAVIADAIGSLTPYIRALFTSRKTIDQIWRSAPNFNNRVNGPIASQRSPSFQYQIDPDSKNRYYRSIAGNLSVTADMITGAAFAPTDVDPGSFVVPGAASVGTAGTTLFPNPDLTGSPVATLAAGTALRLDEAAGDTTGAPTILGVRTLDGGVEGYAAAGELVPRDSVGPILRTFSDGGGKFDAGDPASTGLPFSGSFSETATWRLRFKDADGGTVGDASASGKEFSTTWLGRVDGTALPDGLYPWTLTATDQWGNVMATKTGTARIDSRNRVLAAGSSFTPLEPQRFLDTRIDLGLANRFVSGTPRVLQVAGLRGVPSDAVAITGNLTVTGQTSHGFLSLGPEPVASPATSTLNFPTSDTRANGVVVRLAADGTLAGVFAGSAGARAHVILDVTGYYRLGSDAALYVPVSPARLLDTRHGTGLVDPFLAGTPRTFAVAGREDVPAGAVAVTGNLTVVNQTARGYVSLGPVADATPATSTINFPLGDTRANGVVVPLAADGTLSAVFNSPEPGTTTHLIFDVTGFYRTDGPGSLYVPLEPVRLLDTRKGNGLSGTFATGSPRSVGLANRGGIPASAVAVTGNLTVTRQTSRGFLTLGPTVAPAPETSTLNFPRGDTRANGLASPLGGGNAQIVFVGTPGSSSHVVFDADGYFKPAN